MREGASGHPATHPPTHPGRPAVAGWSQSCDGAVKKSRLTSSHPSAQPPSDTHTPPPRATERFEQLFEQPATEEGIWRAAALYRLHGPERARALIPVSPYGLEKRPLLRAVHALFRGEVEAEAVAALVDGAKGHPYSSYELYGNFYLGLYHDAVGDGAAALEAVGRASRSSKAREEDVMFHFPRLHLTLRERELFSGGKGGL